MADSEYSVPSCVMEAVRKAGWHPDTSMGPRISEWWAWFTATAAWYDGVEIVDGKPVHVSRRSLHPARRVCREWASAILDDDTRFSVSAPDMADDDGSPETTEADASTTGVAGYLRAWMDATGFLTTAQRAMERAFALGTGALALWFDECDEVTVIRARRYDARQVIPLTWDDGGVSECAFCTTAMVAGRIVDQLQMHVVDPDTGTYHIVTRVFSKGVEVHLDGLVDDMDTGSPLPTFCIIEPNIDNTYVDMSPFGQSVFADAEDAIRTVDECFDSFSRELRDTKVKTFMSDELFKVDSKGNPIPMDQDASVVRIVQGTDVSSMISTFAPTIRTEQILPALDMALAQLGDQTGFGAQYFRYDPSGGVKTAYEVSSDNSALARTIAKHEATLRPALCGILEALLACESALNGLPVPDGCVVTVDFDDSIIQDTASEKATALSEVAAGIMSVSEYRQRFYGESSEEAAAHVPSVDSGLDLGTME